MKETSGLAYWEEQYQREGTLLNSWFEHFHTQHFDIPKGFYRDKKLLDIGCGPRGSLEWAEHAAIRVGVDPLAQGYTTFGTTAHEMKYVAGRAERLPFTSDSFDVVLALNSLDHVDDLNRSISEIKRVVVPGGLVLIIADVHEHPTEREPSAFSWDLVDEFEPELRVVGYRHWEKSSQGMYASAQAADRFDHSDLRDRYGVISASFQKRSRPIPQPFQLWLRTPRRLRVLIPRARGQLGVQVGAVASRTKSWLSRVKRFSLRGR